MSDQSPISDPDPKAGLEKFAAWLERARDNLDPTSATIAVKKAYGWARFFHLWTSYWPEGEFSVEEAEQKLAELQRHVSVALTEEGQLEQRRADAERWFAEAIERLSAVKSPAELHPLCLEIRERFHTDWMNVPELLKGVYNAMQRLGASALGRPGDLIEMTGQDVVNTIVLGGGGVAFEERCFSAINQAIEWCERGLSQSNLLDLADGQLFIIGDRPRRLLAPEWAVLEAIAKHGALELGELRRKSNVEDANKVLDALGEKYPALRVDLPGGKGKGGYWANVKMRGWHAQGMREAPNS